MSCAHLADPLTRATAELLCHPAVGTAPIMVGTVSGLCWAFCGGQTRGYLQSLVPFQDLVVSVSCSVHVAYDCVLHGNTGTLLSWPLVFPWAGGLAEPTSGHPPALQPAGSDTLPGGKPWLLELLEKRSRGYAGSPH